MHQKAFTLTLTAILTILVTCILISIVFFGQQTEKQLANTYQPNIPTDAENAEQSYYKTALIEELGISFSYPTAWGELDVEEYTYTAEEDEAPFRKEVIVSTNGIPFLSAVTLGEAPSRQGWWGDIAADAASTTALANWCDQLGQREEFYHQPKETCKIYTNSQELIFVNLHGDIEWFGAEIEDVDTYLGHHPHHPYYGLAISNQQLIYEGMDVSLAEKTLQELIFSLEFTE